MLSQEKMGFINEHLEKRHLAGYFNKASLYKMNNGKDTYKSISKITSKVLNTQDPKPKMSEIHPKLLEELNDSESQIPAYKRF